MGETVRIELLDSVLLCRFWLRLMAASTMHHHFNTTCMTKPENLTESPSPRASLPPSESLREP